MFVTLLTLALWAQWQRPREIGLIQPRSTQLVCTAELCLARFQHRYTSHVILYQRPSRIDQGHSFPIKTPQENDQLPDVVSTPRLACLLNNMIAGMRTILQ